MKRARLAFAAIGLIALTAGIIWVSSGVSDPAVARVGDFTLRRRDVEYRNRILANHPELSDTLGRDQLIRGYRRAQVLQGLGLTVPDWMVDREEEQLRKQARPGNQYEKLLIIFGDDRDALRRVYLFPKVAERILYEDYFLNTEPNRVRAKRRAETFLETVLRQPPLLATLAAKQNLGVYRLSVTRQELRWEEPVKKSSFIGPEVRSPSAVTSKNLVLGDADFWLNRVLAGMKEGEVKSTLVEYQDFWLVLRLLDHDEQNEIYRLDVVRFSKPNFQKWLDPLLAKVPLQIFN
jgi:hypothetical protein